jgi:hypothetical protein
MRGTLSIIQRLRGEGRLPSWTTAEPAVLLWELTSFQSGRTW